MLAVEFVIKYEWPPPTDVSSPLYFYSPKQNYTAEVNCLVALHELYKYINKYYDQVSITKVQKHHSWVV